MEATTILIARHGHVEGVTPERFRGRANVELTQQGQDQARALARAVASAEHPVAIYTSPLRRCIMTAAAAGQACGISPMVLDALNDIDYGIWQWKTPQEMHEQAPELLELWYTTPQLVRFPRGDSLQDIATRTADALRFAREHHAGEKVLFISHDSVIRVMLLQLLNAPLESYWRIAQDPCALNEVEITGTHVSIRRINDISHLA